MNQSIHSPLQPSSSMHWLGYLGLIPFVSLSLVVCFELFDLESEALNILNIYSFGIIAFLCGSGWPKDGDDTQGKKSLISNILFLIAFFSFILFFKEWPAFAACILIVLYLIEHQTKLLGQFNASYKRFRKDLTIIASLSLIVAYIKSI